MRKENIQAKVTQISKKLHPGNIFPIQKNLSVPWIIDGGANINIMRTDALTLAWWSIDFSEVAEKCHMSIL